MAIAMKVLLIRCPTKLPGPLGSDFTCILTIDLNPVKGVGTELFAVDARIIVSVTR